MSSRSEEKNRSYKSSFQFDISPNQPPSSCYLRHKIKTTNNDDLKVCISVDH